MPNHCESDLYIYCDNVVENKKFLKQYFLIPEDSSIYDETDISHMCKEALEKEVLGRKWDLCHITIPYPETFAKRDRIIEKYGRSPTKEQIVEIYKELGETPKKEKPYDGFNSGGYEWCVNNWGTKWGVYDVRLTEAMKYGNGLYLALSFDSAWSPPTPVIKKMGEMFPDLQISMYSYERGCAFISGIEMQRGEIIDEWSHGYYGYRGG